MTEKELVDEIVDRLFKRLAPIVSENRDDRWVGLKRAAQYASLGEHELIRLAKNGDIVGFQDRRKKTRPWIFDRQSLDEFRMCQYTDKKKKARDFAVDLLKDYDV